jgi:ribosomal protein L3
MAKNTGTITMVLIIKLVSKGRSFEGTEKRYGASKLQKGVSV